MVTNQAVYNLSRGNLWTSAIAKIFYSKYIIKRRIPIELIEKISISKKNAEFVLHVPKEYDYRFSHPRIEFRNVIISTIV